MSDGIVTYRELDFMGYPDYRVGDDGSIWTRRPWRQFRDGSWRPLRTGKHPKKGHRQAQLSNSNGKKAFWLHRLILVEETETQT